MSYDAHEAFCMDSFQDRLLWWDDFEGDQLKDEWDSNGDAGGSTSVQDGETGGVVRIETDTDPNDHWIIDWSDIRSLLVSKKVSMEIRAKYSDDDTDIDGRLELFYDGSNRLMFYWKPSETNIQLYVRDDGTATSVDSGVARDTSYHVYRIECHTHGGSHVHFYIDGVETNNSPISTNVPDDAGDYLQPYLRVDTEEDTVAKHLDIDYVYIRQER